jgi:dihydroorotate dehydrogenase (NAD+) catalytic subunit
MRGGADGLTIANCYLGLAVDVHHRRAVFANVVGGVSGPAIRVLTLRLVWQVARAMPGVPIIGLGGVSKAEDAVEYLLAGATGVGVGAASLQHPDAARRIHRGLGEYLQRHGLASVRELIGAL